MRYAMLFLPLMLVITFDKCSNQPGGPASPSADTTLQLVLLKPNGGETYHAGDSVGISFEYRNSAESFHFVTLWFSRDYGKSFDMPVFVTSFNYKGSRKDTVWVIPADSFAFGSYLTQGGMIKVEDYSQKGIIYDTNDEPFAITPSAG
jgi:hypothetical protein